MLNLWLWVSLHVAWWMSPPGLCVMHVMSSAQHRASSFMLPKTWRFSAESFRMAAATSSASLHLWALLCFWIARRSSVRIKKTLKPSIPTGSLSREWSNCATAVSTCRQRRRVSPTEITHQMMNKWIYISVHTSANITSFITSFPKTLPASDKSKPE